MTPERQRWMRRLRYAEEMLARSRAQRRALGRRRTVSHYYNLQRVARKWLDENQ